MPTNERRSLLYIALGSMDSPNMLGVQRKISGQLHAFQRVIGEGHVAVMEQCTDKGILQSNALEQCWPLKKGVNHYRSSMSKCISTNIEQCAFDFIYLRFPGPFDFTTLRILRHFRASKIALEVPTYPLTGEWRLTIIQLLRKHQLARLLLFLAHLMLHVLLRRIAMHYVDFLYVIGDAPKSLWGVKVHPLVNGYIIENEPLPPIKKKTGFLHLVCVSAMEPWHGIDRIISGIADYNSKQNHWIVNLHLVGEGKSESLLREQVVQLGLENQVIFHGPLSGQRLRQIYEDSDIGISSLGLHRNGVLSASVLKSREYCSLGLPFVLAYDDPAFPVEFPYCLHVDATDRPINVEDIVQFYLRLPPEARSECRSYAELTLPWDRTLHDFIDFMKSGNHD